MLLREVSVQRMERALDAVSALDFSQQEIPAGQILAGTVLSYDTGSTTLGAGDLVSGGEEQAAKLQAALRRMGPVDLGLVTVTYVSVGDKYVIVFPDGVATPGAIAYATAKGGVMTMTRGMAKELGPRRIRVNAVAPGMINTTFHDTFTKPEIRQKVASMTPLGREGAAPEVAELVAFLATDASSFINGVAVDINGGILFS